MTHNFKTGVTYKTRGGGKVWFIGEAKKTGALPLAFENEAGNIASYTVRGEYFGDSMSKDDIIGIWEDEPEQIDVANMWVSIQQYVAGDGSMVIDTIQQDGFNVFMQHRETKPKAEPNTIAIIRVHEWEAIKRGERSLIKGEGL